MKNLYILFLALYVFGNAQQAKTDDIDLSSYLDFYDVPHEALHLHLNKNLVVAGEPLGYAMYMKDMATDEVDTLATNVYVIVENETGTIIQKDLLKLQAGYGNGLVETSDLEAGNYRLKGYTSWMKNLEHPHFYQGQFTVVDDSQYSKGVIDENLNYDLQVFAEGGHLIAGQVNTVGVLLKDQYGLGVAINGTVASQTDKIADFSTSKKGLTRFSIRPEVGEKYTVTALINGNKITATLPPAKVSGINIQLVPWTKDLMIKVNAAGNNFEDKGVSIVIHKGKKFVKLNADFKDGQATLMVAKEDIPTGINTLTLFAGNEPIISRVFFNDQNFELRQLKKTAIDQSQDTLTINLSTIQQHDNNMIASVSVLPSETESYHSNNTILHNLLLQPYIKGYVEDPRSYFEQLDTRTLYELDNLLITQGWSSYDWKKKPTVSKLSPYESGISAKVQINGKPHDGYMVLPLAYTNTAVVETDKDDPGKFFTLTNLFPINEEKLEISAFNKRGKSKKTSLAPIFYPRTIPDFDFDYSLPAVKPLTKLPTELSPYISFDDEEYLDAVVVEAERDEDRNRLLKQRAKGRITIFDDAMRSSERNLSTFLNKNGYIAAEYYGELIVKNPRPVNAKDDQPIFIIDDTVYYNFGMLANFDMRIVDYIEINKRGISYGLRAGGGVIIIKTDPSLVPTREGDNKINSYDFPLTFAAPAEYYKPMYASLNSQIFKQLGVIHWQPELRFINGKASMKIPTNYSGDIKLFIEGMDAGGNLLLQEILIDPSNSN